MSAQKAKELAASAQWIVGLLGGILSWTQQYFFGVLPLKNNLALEGVAVSTVASITVAFYVLSQTELREAETLRGRSRRYALLAASLLVSYVFLTQVVQTTGRGGRSETVFEQIVVANFVGVWVVVTAMAAYLLLTWQSKHPRRVCAKQHTFFEESWVYCPYDGSELKST